MTFNNIKYCNKLGSWTIINGLPGPQCYFLTTDIPGLKNLTGSEQEIAMLVTNWFIKLSELEKIVYNIKTIPGKV